MSFIEDKLRNTIAVTQVDKGHPAHTASLLNPASERHLLTDITETQSATGSSAIHILLFLDRQSTRRLTYRVISACSLYKNTKIT